MGEEDGEGKDGGTDWFGGESTADQEKKRLMEMKRYLYAYPSKCVYA
jgi:hypothetical protein